MRAVIVLIIALALGGGAVLFASKMLGAKPAAKSVAPTITKIVVAGADVAAGNGFKPEELKLADWPVNKVPQGAFKDLAQVKDRLLKQSAAKDAPIVESMLMPPGAIGGMSAQVKPGMRAMTVKVDHVSGVAGFTLPGNYVDVLASVQLEGDGQKKRVVFLSKVLLEKVLVLAVADQTTHDDTKPKPADSVTLEVTPQQAELLDIARNGGRLSLVLRSQEDDQTVKTTGMTKQALAALLKPQEKRGQCSSVIMGAQAVQECF